MEQHWYAIYTKSKTEKILQTGITHYSQLHSLNYETFLPVRHDVKQWRGRIKIKESPLFENYLFVKHDNNAFHPIKAMKGFCHYVKCGLTPLTIPVQQMDMIKKMAKFQVDDYCCNSQLVIGKKVKICHGPLAGLEGILLENKQSNTVAIEIKSLKLRINVNIPKDNLVCL